MVFIVLSTAVYLLKIGLMEGLYLKGLEIGGGRDRYNSFG